MTRRAFTFIELMLMIACIAVLAAMAVPNFLEAQVRSKVARARADMATAIAALEDYRLDHHDYPPNPLRIERALTSGVASIDVIFSSDRSAGYQPILAFRWFEAGETRVSEEALDYTLTRGRIGQITQTDAAVADAGAEALRRLTTPVPYLNELPVDPFSLYRGQPIIYVNWSDYSDGGLRLFSSNVVAPFGLVSIGPDSGMTNDLPWASVQIPYDPTNGTTSNGDIIETTR